MSRRDFLLFVLSAFAAAALSSPARAKDGESSGSGSDSDSGSGSDNSGSGSSDDSGSDDDGGDDNGGGDDSGEDGQSGSNSSSSGSGSHNDQDYVRDAVERGDIISLEKAMKSLRRSQKGRVIDARLRSRGREFVYTFKVKSPDGTVRRIEMNARTGMLRN